MNRQPWCRPTHWPPLQRPEIEIGAARTILLLQQDNSEQQRLQRKEKLHTWGIYWRYKQIVSSWSGSSHLGRWRHPKEEQSNEYQTSTSKLVRLELAETQFRSMLRENQENSLKSVLPKIKSPTGANVLTAKAFLSQNSGTGAPCFIRNGSR